MTLGRTVIGRFTPRFEVHSIGDGISAELQNPVGQTVLWWVFNVERTHVDPTYDVGSYWVRGRVWYTPFIIPVVLASIEQGAGGHNERGQYTIDYLQLIINTPEILLYLPSIVWEPDLHLNDRIEYRGGLFQPTTVMPKGHVAESMVVIRVLAEQIKDEEVVNDVQFNGMREYPSPFSEEFNAKEFEAEIYPPDAEFSDEFRPGQFDAVGAEIDVVVQIPRWGLHHPPPSYPGMPYPGIEPRPSSELWDVPQVVNATAYSGNPFNMRVIAPDALVAGKTWTAQLRKSATDPTVDATFTITTPTFPGGPAYVSLDGATTAALVGTNSRYVGEYDVRVGGEAIVRGQLVILKGITP